MSARLPHLRSQLTPDAEVMSDLGHGLVILTGQLDGSRRNSGGGGRGMRTPLRGNYRLSAGVRKAGGGQAPGTSSCGVAPMAERNMGTASTQHRRPLCAVRVLVLS